MATVRQEIGGVRKKKKPLGSSSTPKKTKSSGSGFLAGVGSSVEDIQEGASLVIYGPPGVGKTSLAAQFPMPIFLCDKQEHGIHRLMEQRMTPRGFTKDNIGPDIMSWDGDAGLLPALQELATEAHSYQTVVIDSLTGMQRLCFESCCEDRFNGDMSRDGFFAYQQGPHIAGQDYWPQLLNALCDLIAQNINVVLIAHSLIKEFKNPEGPDYDKFIPDVHDKIWKPTSKWAGAVCFYKHNVDVQKEGKKSKGVGGSSRVLATEFDAAFEAKSSYRLSPLIGPSEDVEEIFKEVWAGIRPASPTSKKVKRTSV